MSHEINAADHRWPLTWPPLNRCRIIVRSQPFNWRLYLPGCIKWAQSAAILRAGMKLESAAKFFSEVGGAEAALEAVKRVQEVQVE